MLRLGFALLLSITCGCDSRGRSGGGGRDGFRDGGGTTGMPCASDRDCADEDPCTEGELCDDSTRTCRIFPLDGDFDGDPPRVCGGGDCDDADEFVSSLRTEDCDGYDNDCDSTIDEDSDASCGPGTVCRGGECGCADGSLAFCGGDGCVDTRNDARHCGRCYQTCPGACSGGICTCPSGQTYCEFSGCVDTRTNAVHCGGCDNLCPEECVGGVCTACGAFGQPCCGGACDSSNLICRDTRCVNCGALGQPCCAGSTCVVGACELGTCVARECEEPLPRYAGALPRCSAATRTCLDACTTSTCLTGCLDADTTPPSAGADCGYCVGYHLTQCGDASCHTQWAAYACCADDMCPAGSAPDCARTRCSTQLTAFNTCVDDRAPSCRYIFPTAEECFPPA